MCPEISFGKEVSGSLEDDSRCQALENVLAALLASPRGPE